MPDYDSRAAFEPPVENTGTRAEVASRNIVARYMGKSIPSRGFLNGENDHSVIMTSVREFTEEVYVLGEAIFLDDPRPEVKEQWFHLINLMENRHAESPD